MLSRLQHQVAQIVAGLAEAEEFVLAGGAALIARGEVQRTTRDLDFFGLTSESVDRLVPAVERALREAGLGVRQLQVNPTTTGPSSTSPPTLAYSPWSRASRRRRWPARKLAVDKVLAIFGRAETRDYVDLMAVERFASLPRKPHSSLCQTCRGVPRLRRGAPHRCPRRKSSSKATGDDAGRSALYGRPSCK